MQNDYKSKSFKEWLDKLQQESWQLELIISGFSIYGLTQVFEPLNDSFTMAQNDSNTIKIIIFVIALFACSILLTTLLLHVILRGLWIGALGLRYVSGDINYEKLNYRPKFDNYLRKKIGSFDKYISKLEDYCSVLFAIAFLLIFYLISFFIITGVITAIAYFFLKDHENKHIVLFVIGIVLMVFILLGMLFTFIDFLTQGYLKRNKWLAKVYFPFYWVFSYLMLSFLYRPLVYNFLDNKFGKRLSYILIPLYFLISMLGSFNFIKSNYLSSSDASSTFIANILNYDDEIIKKDMFVSNASIPSKIITTHYLPIFIKQHKVIEDAIFEYNEALKPEEDLRGISTNIFVSTKKEEQKQKIDSLRIDYIKTLSKIYSFKIDSLEFNNIEFVFTKHNTNQDGFESVVSLKQIEDGKHDLEVYRLNMENDSLKQKLIATIPFWLYKE
ncbi:hypothetical protein [Lacinutrix sp.]|uniref:hypothetical protein n=1 Tax=Lacinutrix sp. TaxID=1937692 RepID=UPI0025C1AA80|nr:hypothetical protein [Lacinutrix sp.]